MIKNSEIIKVLKACKVQEYELSEVNKDSCELFYVLQHLEINRKVKTTDKSVTVYVNKRDKKGSSLITITAADDAKTLKNKINQGTKKANATLNPYYELASKTTNINEDKVGKVDLNDIACKVGKAVFAGDVFKQGWINSTEIFVSKVTNSFINSKGINHKTSYFTIQVEVIPTWKGQKEEIELYKFVQTSNIDYKYITEQIRSVLENARERSVAKKIKDIKLPKNVLVLVQDDMLALLARNIKSDLSFAEAYTKQNHYKLKDQISDNKFSITLKPVIKGCVNSSKYDGNGIVLKNINIVKDGVVKNLWGDLKFGYYLKQKNITGNLPLMELKGETLDYKKQKHIIIENFSSPQLDETSGYWGGEVRLAKYFDGKKYIPLTGFSISGNIYQDMKNFKFSKEECKMASYAGPKYWIFNNISIH